MIYLPPNIWVVSDHTTVLTPTDDQYMGFHFGKTPVSVSAPGGMSRYDVSNGGTFKGTEFAVLPASAPTTLVDTHAVHAVYRVETRPSTAGATQTWLHVFDASTSAGAVTVPAPLTSGGLDAIQLGSVVTAFAQTDPPLTTMSYAFAAGAAVTHYVAGMVPSASYQVSTD